MGAKYVNYVIIISELTYASTHRRVVQKSNAPHYFSHSIIKIAI